MVSYLLVVDDDKILTLLIETQLKGTGIDVITAYNAEEALNAVVSLKPKTILLDINMPDFNGLDILNIINKNIELKGTRVLVMSTSSNQSKLDLAMQMGAYDYLHKPINTNKLISLLDSMIKDN